MEFRTFLVVSKLGINRQSIVISISEIISEGLKETIIERYIIDIVEFTSAEEIFKEILPRIQDLPDNYNLIVVDEYKGVYQANQRTL